MAVYFGRRQLIRTAGSSALALASAPLLSSLDLAAQRRTATLPAGGPVPARVAPHFVRVSLASGIVALAGQTSMDFAHPDPHDPREQAAQPDDIRLQTRLVMRNQKEVLDWAGLGWHNVVKLTRYQTRMDESPYIEAVLRSYFGEWWPPQAVRRVSALPSPRARIAIDMWVAPPDASRVVG
jgi:enamine deaminase RidA (YjgF/YER057c/UK114 family)